MRTVLFLALVLAPGLLMTSCTSNEIGSSKDVNAESIYLDYAATTPCDARVVQAMLPWLAQNFGNPASRSHAWGWEAEEAVEKSRAQVAALIGRDTGPEPEPPANLG